MFSVIHPKNYKKKMLKLHLHPRTNSIFTIKFTQFVNKKPSSSTSEEFVQDTKAVLRGRGGPTALPRISVAERLAVQICLGLMAFGPGFGLAARCAASQKTRESAWCLAGKNDVISTVVGTILVYFLVWGIMIIMGFLCFISFCIKLDQFLDNFPC